MDKKEIRYAVASYLPDELQVDIWKRYHTTYVIPCLLRDVEAKLCNKEFEGVFEQAVSGVDYMLALLINFRNNNEDGFNVSLDFVEDRMIDAACGSILFDMYFLLWENRHDIQAMKKTILSIEAFGYKKMSILRSRLSALETILRMLIPYSADESEFDEDV